MKAAQRLGWAPADLWAATMWEFETAILSRVEDATPPEPTASQDDLLGYFRSLPGYTLIEAQTEEVT